MFSVLIPVLGNKDVSKTIQSVLNQNISNYEIMILRNGIEAIPERKHRVNNLLIRELFIHQRGKANAINEGIKKASGELIILVDADCLLHENALKYSLRHFEDKEVVAVGGRIVVNNPNQNLLTKLQQYEYLKAFQLGRRLFASIDAHCLVSGAFGVFRKSELIKVNGFDTNTVGEDMEIVLRLQDKQSGNRIVYESKAVCSTNVPTTIKRLLHQRDRWQRGLLDCLLKHRHMIFNQSYGCLGLITLPYQLLVELFSPVFFCLYLASPTYRNVLPCVNCLFILYILLEFLLNTLAVYLEKDKKIKAVILLIPEILFITLISIPYQSMVMLARFYAIVTFPFRRHVW